MKRCEYINAYSEGSSGTINGRRRIGHAKECGRMEPCYRKPLRTIPRFPAYGASNLRFAMAASAATLAYRIAAPMNCATSS
jgi:hypothetical protein